MKYLHMLALGALIVPLFSGCDTLNQVTTGMPQTGTGSTSTTNKSSGTITQTEAVTGIKQALSNGLNNSINILSAQNGFLGDAAVKILIPKEAQQVEKTLRSVGMGALCDN